MLQNTRTRPRRGLARAVGGGALIALVGGMFVPAAAPALAAPDTPAETALEASAGQPYTQDFESAPDASTGPEGWTVERTNTEGMREGWEGWSFHTLDEVTAEFGAGGARGEFSLAEGRFAVVQSDGNRPAAGAFDSVLWAPEYELSDSAAAVKIEFDSHYRQGQNPPARLIASFDGAEPVAVETFDRDRRNEAVSASVDVPAGAERVTVGWEYTKSSNNWYWMIDDVSIAEGAPADARPVLESSPRPVAAPGGSTTVRLSGLRSGQQLEAVLGDAESGTRVEGIAPADETGAVSFDVRIPEGQPAGTLPLHLSGEGIVPLVVEISVFARSNADRTTTEPQLWFDGFEGGEDRWTRSGSSDWALTTLPEVVETYGTDRRQAFTRASGAIAVAEALRGAFDGALVSEPVALESASGLELRFDSHYRARGGTGSGAVVAKFDDGSERTVYELGADDEESAQPRIPLEIPEGARTATFEFRFSAPAGGGSWMIDDVQLVTPLPDLADGAEPLAEVDVFSDVQGSNDRLRNNVVPGFAKLAGGRADVLLANGDLTGQGTEGQYDAYLSALAAGGGDEYETTVSTIGNHEFYGSNGSDVYIQRFLDRTGMRDLGVEGSESPNRGLWGETLVGGELPLLWIGSEYYEYPDRTGSGPFVKMSDEQFHWLRERLEHYDEQGEPVLLASHHVFAGSNSGTYIRFNRNDFGDDTERIEALLSEHPNVTVLTGHTHWSAELNDWSVEQRFDPAAELAPTIVNTAAVTTQYGPSGDWGEVGIGGADPVGLRAALYEDRLRITAYSFDGAGDAREIKHVDVPLPAEPGDDGSGDAGSGDAGGGSGSDGAGGGSDDGAGGTGSGGAEGGAGSDAGANAASGAEADGGAPSNAGVEAGPGLARTGGAALTGAAILAVLVAATGAALVLRRRTSTR